MPSTFTSNMALEKQATGEHQDVWGDHLNTIFDQIDRGIAARLSIVLSGDLTLVASQYENRSIEFTGALTANTNVIFPAIKKGWLIKNSTTGAFPLTCKTAAGTGVVVNQGDFSLIEGDGTNVIANRFVTQDGQENYATTGGAADAYTLTVYPAISAYRAGQKFRGKWSATNLTTTPTMAISGLAAKTLKISGSAVPIGSLQSGKLFEVTYDGTDLQISPYWENLVNPGSNYNFTGTNTFSGPVTFAGLSTFTGVVENDAGLNMVGAAINHADWLSLPSAGTVDLSTVNRDNLFFTGTASVSNLGTVNAGIRRRIRTLAGMTWIQDGAHLFLPNYPNNWLAQQNDVYDFTSLGAGVWLLSSYLLATGKAIAADFQKLLTFTAAASASLDFNLSAYVSQFSALRVIGNMLAPTNNAVDFWLETSQDGTTFDVGASNYAYSTEEFTPAGVNSQSSTGDTKIIMNSADTLGNAANQNLSFDLMIYNPSQGATFGTMQWTFALQSSASRLDVGRGSGRRLAVAQIKGLRFLTSTSTIASGRIDVYGIR